MVSVKVFVVSKGQMSFYFSAVHSEHLMSHFFTVFSRISIRAFTQLFSEDPKELPKPLFADTFFSLPITTEAG